MPVEPMEVKGKVVSERIGFSPRAAGEVPGKGNVEKGDLNYIEIGQVFKKMVGGDPASDMRIANQLLMMMMGADVPGLTAPQKDFMAGMVALMFGLEATRFPSSLATSIMLLDLVRKGCTYGRNGTSKFTLAKAFDKPDVSFDHGELYGGKFPCAVHTPGPENSRNRRMLGELGLNPKPEWERDERTFLQDATLKLNHRFVVPRREVTLFVHWIEASIPDDTQLRRMDSTTLETLLFRRLTSAYSSSVPNNPPDQLPGNPRRDTGQHLFEPYSVNPLDDRSHVFWYDNGKYFHNSLDCKLISDRSLFPVEYERSFKDPNRLEDTKRAQHMQRWHEGTALEAATSNLGATAKKRRGCPYCIVPWPGGGSV